MRVNSGQEVNFIEVLSGFQGLKRNGGILRTGGQPVIRAKSSDRLTALSSINVLGL